MPKQEGIIPLKRTLSLLLVTLYGVGTILGAGIYVLIGQVAGQSISYAPLAFLFAATIAFFTAVSYAELSSRFPKSAGEAYYVRQAFQKSWLSGLIGWLVIFTGIVSAATIVNGFVGYFQLFLPVASWIIIIGILVVLGGIASWGIKESAITSMVITLIEIGGLLLVVFVAGDKLSLIPEKGWSFFLPENIHGWMAISSGAFIAFYAYIGFEDMVNLAEEVKNPAKILPKAIFLALILSTFLYVLVALVAVLALPIQELAQSNAPLALIVERQGYSPTIIALISLFAIINGGLVQIIMASRVMYGMAKQKNAPRIFAAVHPKTQTPLFATLLVTLIIMILALWFPITTLAKATSTVILCIFIIINLSLIIIKLRAYRQEGAASYSIFFPIMGVLLSGLFLLLQMI